jgi:hypothetical protein
MALECIYDAVSLLDMLRVYAEHYVHIGEAIQAISSSFCETVSIFPSPEVGEAELDLLMSNMQQIREHCDQLELSVSSEFIGHYLHQFSTATAPPKRAEVKGFVDNFRITFIAELKKRIFAFIPPHKAAAFENEQLFDGAVAKAFPSASKDIKEAGTAYSLGLNNASVFHSMRVLEAGLRALAKEFSLPFGLEQWQNIIEQIEAKVQGLKSLPKGTAKVELQEFYSKAAKEFMYFKDAWRNHVMHARGSYDEEEARKVLEQVDDFMRHLATKLAET